MTYLHCLCYIELEKYTVQLHITECSFIVSSLSMALFLSIQFAMTLSISADLLV